MPIPLAVPLILAGVSAASAIGSKLAKKDPKLTYKYDSQDYDPMKSIIPGYIQEAPKKTYEYQEQKNSLSKGLDIASTVTGAASSITGAMAAKPKVPSTNISVDTPVDNGPLLSGSEMSNKFAKDLEIDPQSVISPMQSQSMLEMPETSKITPTNDMRNGNVLDFRNESTWNSQLFKKIPTLSTIFDQEKFQPWMNFQNSIKQKYSYK